MNANELRLGNWVNYIEHNEPCSIKGINIDGLLVFFPKFKEETWIEIEQFQPIPLTPEILEKAGFSIHSKHSFWNFINNKGFVISMWMEDKSIAGFEKRGICYWGENYTAITYLHQLQNLYFALTGKELEINL